MTTQRTIYELVKRIGQGDESARSKLFSLKEAGQIAYDFAECWYRPVDEVGTPLDMDLYNEFWSVDGVLAV